MVKRVGAVAAAAMSFGTSYGFVKKRLVFTSIIRTKGEEVLNKRCKNLQRIPEKGKAASGYEEN
ncbi:hypothetical protein O9993_18790 [Vibrio lentus]|nr:hypothetical protein [Vibrio lentus]